MYMCPPPRPHCKSPSWELPRNACDTVCHVIGPGERFPFSPERKYDAPDAPFESLLALHDRLGFDRAVLVQASIHGTDNSAMLDALRRSGGRYRGVALIDETISDEQIAQLHADGVRGVRFNFVRMLGGPPDLDAYDRLLERIRPFGWHAALHVGLDELAEHEERFRRSVVPVVIEHLGRADISQGVDGEGFRRLLRLARNENVWIKIDMGDRLSLRGAPYGDVVPFARAVVEVASERTLWGTDWPHPMYAADREMPDDGELVDLFRDYVPDPELRHRILVENPERLYGFGEATGLP